MYDDNSKWNNINNKYNARMTYNFLDFLQTFSKFLDFSFTSTTKHKFFEKSLISLIDNNYIYVFSKDTSIKAIMKLINTHLRENRSNLCIVIWTNT